MQPLTSYELQFVTSARPELVWPIVTDRDGRIRYLHGLVLRAAWVPGGTVEVFVDGEEHDTAAVPGLHGEVLAVEPPHLLSFTFAADAQSPTTYVTWEVRAGPNGTVVRLLVDELDGDDDTGSEQRWRPVLRTVRDAVHVAARTESNSPD